MNITNKGILIGAGVVALGIGVGVYFGRKKAKKNKENKEVENEIAEMKKYEEQMRKQAEEERVRAEEDEKWIKTTDEMIKKAEEVQKESPVYRPVYREDLVEAVTRDPEFAKLLMKYISPVEAMAMKHMPSRNDVVSKPVTESMTDDGHYNNNAKPMHKVDNQKGVEYDVIYPMDSVHDITNIKPLNIEPIKQTLADQANDIREEFDNAIKTLSEDDQLAIANRIIHGACIVICGKQVQLSDLTIMKADINQISEKVLTFILSNTYRINPDILHSSVRNAINNIIGGTASNQMVNQDNSNTNTSMDKYEYELQRLTVEQQFAIMSKLLSGETVTIADRKVEMKDLPAVRNNANLLTPEFQVYIANMMNQKTTATQTPSPVQPSVQMFATPNVDTRIDRFGSKVPASNWKTSAAASNAWIKNYRSNS